jgi:signal peptidase II
MNKKKNKNNLYKTIVNRFKGYIKVNKIFTILAVSIIILDKLTKVLVKKTFMPGESVHILGNFFKLTFIENRGIAFGLFSDWNHPVKAALFFLLSIAALVFISNIYIKSNKSKLIQISFGLIFGGAFGNIYDRVIYGRVVDFMNFDFFNINIPAFQLLGISFNGFQMYRWPIWNVADASITIGVMIIMILTFLKKDNL